MAFPSADCRTTTDGRATRLVAVRLCLPATLRRRLLFQPSAQPFPAALRLRTQGRADRPPGRHQPAHRPRTSKASLPRRRSRQPTTAWPAGPTASCCHAMPAPSPSSSLTHADATRYDMLDFIERTWGVRVSTVALHHFCKKFGLDRATPGRRPAPPAAEQRPGRTPAEPRLPCEIGATEPARAAAASPFFSTRTAVRGGVPADAARLGLVGHGRGLFRRRLRFLAAGLVDQHLLFGGRPGTHLPSGRDGRPRLRPPVRRPPLSVAPHRRRLAAAPGLV